MGTCRPTDQLVAFFPCVTMKNGAQIYIYSVCVCGGGFSETDGSVFVEYMSLFSCVFVQIPHLRPAEYKNTRLSKSKKTVHRAYGGSLCGECVRARCVYSPLVYNAKGKDRACSCCGHPRLSMKPVQDDRMMHSYS